jgi:hypothetical protein
MPTSSSVLLDDVGAGVTEVTRAVARGFLDAAANLISTGDEFEAWLGTLTPEQIAMLPPPLMGMAAVAKMIPPEWMAKWDQAVRAAPDIIGPPKSVTGNLISGAIEFIVGMKGFTGALKAMRVAVPAEGALASGASMATAFDPTQDTLAELMESNPTLAKLVPDFLVSQPGDSRAEQRLKNFVEGTALGFVGQGFLRALKVFKAAHAPALQLDAAQKLPGTISEAVEPATSPSSGMAPEMDPALLEHGDPEGPLVQRASEGAGAQARAADDIDPRASDVETDTGNPFSWLKRTRYTDNRTLKRQWEELHGRRWPVDPKTGKDLIVHHKIALADGGPDHVSNIEPVTRDEHADIHRRDFPRWGKRKDRGKGKSK